MAYLRMIDRHEADGELLEAYSAMRARPIPSAYASNRGGAPGIIKSHSLDPELLRRTFAVTGSLHNDVLPWRARELVNSVTARENECFY